MSIFDFSGEKTMNFGDKKLFFYSVDKDEELLKMNFEGLDTFFKSLDKIGRKGIGHAMIMFDGYNHVSTELNEIPEVRKFVKELFNRYPHVLNYINYDLEGHHVLLSSLLDIETVYAGERLTFAEHAKKYGFRTPMPRYNIKLDIPKELLAHIIKAMFLHGNKTRNTKYADRQVHRLMQIFQGAT